MMFNNILHDHDLLINVTSDLMISARNLNAEDHGWRSFTDLDLYIRRSKANVLIVCLSMVITQSFKIRNLHAHL